MILKTLWVTFLILAIAPLAQAQTPQEKLRLKILSDPNLKPLVQGLIKKYPKACESLTENKGNRTYQIYQEAGAGFYNYEGNFEVEQGAIFLRLVCWYGYHFILETEGRRAFDKTGDFKAIPLTTEFRFNVTERVLARYLHFELKDKPNTERQSQLTVQNDPMIKELFQAAEKKIGNCKKRDVSWNGTSNTKYYDIAVYNSKLFNFRFECKQGETYGYEFTGRYFEKRDFALIENLEFYVIAK